MTLDWPRPPWVMEEGATSPEAGKDEETTLPWSFQEGLDCDTWASAHEAQLDSDLPTERVRVLFWPLSVGTVSAATGHTDTFPSAAAVRLSRHQC